MTVVQMHEAKRQLFRLIQKVEGEEEVVIARGSKRVVKLVPYDSIKAERKPGYLKGRIKIAADFDAPLPEVT